MGWQIFSSKSTFAFKKGVNKRPQKVVLTRFIPWGNFWSVTVWPDLYESTFCQSKFWAKMEIKKIDPKLSTSSLNFQPIFRPLRTSEWSMASPEVLHLLMKQRRKSSIVRIFSFHCVEIAEFYPHHCHKSSVKSIMFC